MPTSRSRPKNVCLLPGYKYDSNGHYYYKVVRGKRQKVLKATATKKSTAKAKAKAKAKTKRSRSNRSNRSNSKKKKKKNTKRCCVQQDDEVDNECSRNTCGDDDCGPAVSKRTELFGSAYIHPYYLAGGVDQKDNTWSIEYDKIKRKFASYIFKQPFYHDACKLTWNARRSKFRVGLEDKRDDTVDLLSVKPDARHPDPYVALLPASDVCRSTGGARYELCSTGTAAPPLNATLMGWYWVYENGQSKGDEKENEVCVSGDVLQVSPTAWISRINQRVKCGYSKQQIMDCLNHRLRKWKTFFGRDACKYNLHVSISGTTPTFTWKRRSSSSGYYRAGSSRTCHPCKCRASPCTCKNLCNTNFDLAFPKLEGDEGSTGLDESTEDEESDDMM